jgi:hypothetical protein
VNNKSDIIDKEEDKIHELVRLKGIAIDQDKTTSDKIMIE